MDACEKCGEKHERPGRPGKPTCAGHRSGDKHFCVNYPVDGTTVCRKHGAAAPQVRSKALEVVQAAELRRQATKIGVPLDVNEAEGMMSLVREAAGNVEFYRQLVQELPTHPGDDEFGVDDEGNATYVRGTTGIYGRTYHVSGIPTGEAKPHILVVLYNEERDRLSSYCQAALKAGIEERRVQLAERDAKELFAGIGKAITKAKLTPEQSEVFRVELAAHLRSLQPA